MFNKQNTLQAKGAAVLLMLCHHLFFFKDRIPLGSDMTTGIMISDWDLINIIGAFGKLCVGIFMFLGGYGLFCSYSSARKDPSGEKAGAFFLKRIIRIYKGYWKVFLIFIPIGFLFFSDQTPITQDQYIAGVFSNFQIKPVISNFVLMVSTINREWWFYRTYLFAVFLGLIFIQVFKNRKNIYVEFFTVALFLMITRGPLPYLAAKEGMGLNGTFWYSNLLAIDDCAAAIMAGVIFAKYDIFKSWKKLFEKFTRPEKLVISLLSIVLLAYVRTFILPIYTEAITVPVFITALMLITDSFKPVGATFAFLGRFSTNIWLTHTFYCYYFTPVAKFIYKFDSPIAAFLITLALSLVTAILLDIFWKYLFIGVKKFRRGILDLYTKDEEEAPLPAGEAAALPKAKKDKKAESAKGNKDDQEK